MLLNAKQACEYLGIRKIENFRKLVRTGQIGYKEVGRSKYYTKEGLDRWLKELSYTNYIKEEKRGGRTSQYRQNKEIIGLDALLSQATKSKQSYSAQTK